MKSDLENSNSGTLDSLDLPQLAARSSFGGVLMGLANLVPGISGGTMLLAAGVYPQFIKAVAEVTRFRFRTRSLIILSTVAVSAAVAILLMAGFLKEMVVTQRWIMYSLFIGLTLGGVPVVWRLAKGASAGLIFAAIGAFLAMAGLAYLQANGFVGQSNSNFFTFLIAGLAGASAMILPGLSGGYLLLLLGQYVPILSGIDKFKEALSARDISAALAPAMDVMLPVGIGVVVGIAAVGNLLQWLLDKFREPTLGVLLGLLLGSVVGLYPFQESVEPPVGSFVKGTEVTAQNLAEIDQEDWPTKVFRPKPVQIAGSIGLILLGIGVTAGVAHLGKEKTPKEPQTSQD